MNKELMWGFEYDTIDKILLSIVATCIIISLSIFIYVVIVLNPGELV